jgi:hypothetical protein
VGDGEGVVEGVGMGVGDEVGLKDGVGNGVGVELGVEVGDGDNARFKPWLTVQVDTPLV